MALETLELAAEGQAAERHIGPRAQDRLGSRRTSGWCWGCAAAERGVPRVAAPLRGGGGGGGRARPRPAPLGGVRPLSIFASTCSCAPRVYYFAAPVTRQSGTGAAGPRSTLRECAARPGSSVSLRSYFSPAAPTGPSAVPRFIGAYSSSPVKITVPFWV